VLLQAGQLLSSAGTQSTSIAYALLTLALTGSPAKAGLVGFMRLAPFAALALPAGVAADRFDRRRIMVAADAVRGIALGLLAAALVAGRASFGAILAVAFVEGAGTAFFFPASAGALRSVVPTRQLPSAAGAGQARQATVRLAGPPLGGALFGIGRAVPFVFDALSYGGSLVSVLLMRTPFGRHVYATGGNRDAAWLSGVRVNRVLMAVYVLCGLSAGLAGVLVASRLNAGYPRAGELYELDAVAAVVVGGTSLFGGRGSIWGTLAGAFFIGILNNGLNLYNVSPYDQMIVKGAVLLAAASLDRWRTA